MSDTFNPEQQPPTDPTFDPIMDATGDPIMDGPPAADPSQPSLGQRLRSNITDALYRGTASGPASLNRPPVPSDFEERTGIPAEFAEATGEFQDPEEKQKVLDRLLAYDLMPGSQSLPEYGAALTGQVIGGMLSPETWIAPQVRVGTAAWRAAHPILQRVFGAGVGAGAVNVALDPVAQTNAIEAGALEHYDWLRTALAFPVGFVVGGTFQGAAELRRQASAAITGRPDLPPASPERTPARVWEPEPQPARAAEVEPTAPMPGERPIAETPTSIAGQEIQIRGVRVKQSSDNTVFMSAGDGAGKGDSDGDLLIVDRGDAFQTSMIVVSNNKRRQGVATQLYEAAIEYAAERGKPLRSSATLSDAAARVWESLERKGYAVERHPGAHKVNGRWHPESVSSWIFQIRGQPKRAAEPSLTQLAPDADAVARPDVDAAPAMPPETPRVVEPIDPATPARPETTAAVGNVEIRFPDQDHAILYDIGRRLREREGGVEPAELERTFRRFKGFAIEDDPEFGPTFNNWRDLGELALDYYDRLVEEAAKGRSFRAWDMIDPDARPVWMQRVIDEQAAELRIAGERPFTVAPEVKRELIGMIDGGTAAAEIAEHPTVRQAYEQASRIALSTDLPGYGTPEFKASREFNFDGERVVGYEEATRRLIERARSFSTAGTVKRERIATIVLGPPASGKSMISERLARSRFAALVDPDEAKPAMPGYQGGIGANSVHEESSEISVGVLKELARTGTNLVLPKVGARIESIRGLIQDLQAIGYRVDIANMTVSPENAYRRMIRRFLTTGRIVSTEYFDAVGEKPRQTYYILKNEGLANEAIDIDGNGPPGALSIIDGAETGLAASIAGGPRRGVDRQDAPGTARAAPGAEPRPARAERPAEQPAQTGELIGDAVPAIAPHRVTAADGKPVQVVPVVVEASTLKTSADAGYDAELQPRDRDRAASQAQIREIATRLDPERLGFSTEADRGAPIVGPDAMVESGNGRVLAVRRVYQEGTEAAQRYRDWLESQGVDVGAYREPILVRQRISDMTPEERRAFTVASNQSSTLAMSASERALADARQIDDAMLGLIRNPSDLGAIGNRDFVRSFIGRLPQSEQGMMSTAEGGLSSEGLTRVRNAILARAYGDDPALIRIAEATSDEVKSISNALVDVAPAWAGLRSDVEAGRVRADVDLTPQLLQAVARTADLRSKGTKLDAFLAQQDAFDQLPGQVERFMRLFYDPAGRRAISGEKIAERLRLYVQEARKVSAEQGLDLGMARVTADDLQQLALRRGDASGEQATLFGGGPGTGASRGPGGREGRGQELGGRRADTGIAGRAEDEAEPALAASMRRDGVGTAARLSDLAPEELERRINLVSAALEANPQDQSLRAELTRLLEANTDQVNRALFGMTGDAEAELLARRSGTPRPTFATGRGGATAQAGPGSPVERIASPQQAMRRIADALETIVSDERLHIRGAEAEYDSRTATMRLRNVTDVDAFTHELGHHIEFRAGDPLRQIVQGAMPELVNMVPADLRTTLKPKELRAEAFAEFANRFLISEALALRDAPQFTRDFIRFMQDRFPAVLDEMVQFRDAYARWENAPSGVALRATIVQPARIEAAASRATGNPMERSAFGEFFYNVRRSVFDRMEALNELTRAAAARRGSIVAAEDNPGMLLRRASQAAERSTERDYAIGVGGRPHELTVNGQKIQFSPRDVYEGFTTDPRSGLYDPERALDADSYLRSRRALDLIDEYRNGLRERRPDIGSHADHVNEVARVEALHPEFKTFADMLSVIHADDVVRQYAAGLITAEERNLLLRNRSYVPFRRDMRLNETDVAGGMGAGSRATSAGFDSIRRLKGSDRDIISPLASFIRQMHETNVRERINDGVSAIARMIHEMGPDGAAIGEEISLTRTKANKVDVLEAIRVKAREMNLPKEDTDALVKSTQDILNGADAVATLFRSEKAGPRDVGGNVLFWRDAGEVRALILRDTPFARDIHAAVESVGRPMVDMVTKVAGNLVNVSRVAVTGAPTFAVTNAVTDAFTRVLTDFRMGRTGTALDYFPGLPFIKSLGATLRQMGVTAVRDAEEKLAGAARLAGIDLGREPLTDAMSAVSNVTGLNRVFLDPKLSTIERALLAREGLIGTTNAQYVTNLLSGTADPLKALRVPGYNIGERPLLGVITAGFRAMRAGRGITTEMREAAQLAREFAAEKYGPDAPALGLRLAGEYMLDAARLGTTDPIHAVFRAFRYIAEISEPSGRFAAARDVLRYELRASGVSRADYRAFLADPESVPQPIQGKIMGAIYESVSAANGVADFQRAGNIMTGVGRLALFLNSHLQGLSAHAGTVKAMFSPASAAVTRKQEVIAQERIYGAWHLASVLGATFAYASMKTIEGDERWQNTPEWRKMQNWVIPINADYNLVIRKPFEWRAYINAVEAIAERWGGRGETHDAMKQVVASLWDGLAPPNPFQIGRLTEIPQAVRANFDSFRQRKIVPEVMEKLSPEMQFNDNTSGAAVAWAGFWNATMRGLGLGDVPQKTRNSLGQVLFSPMMADYVGKTLMAGAYTDLRGAVLDPLAGRDSDLGALPITRGFLARTLLYGEARSAINENVSRHGGQLSSALADYLRLASEGGDPGAYFRSLRSDQQAYVALMAPDRRREGAGIKNLHPMERMRAAATALNQVSRMVDQGRVTSLDDPEGGFTISDQALRKSLRDTLGRIHELEARNALILSGDSAWKGAPYKTNEVAALYDKLRVLDPRVHAELADRYATGRVFRFSTLFDPSTGRGLWPEIAERLRRDGGDITLRPEWAEATSIGFELDGDRKKKRRLRPPPPGQQSAIKPPVQFAGRQPDDEPDARDENEDSYAQESQEPRMTSGFVLS